MARIISIFFLWVITIVALSGKEPPIFLEKWKVPVTELPLIAGSAKAEHWVIVFSKWNCQICGMMHHSWREVLKDFPDGKVGVVMLPGVSLQGVDSLQKLMLSVWRADPQAYQNVADMIWAGALTQNNVAEIRRNLADFMGGEDKLLAAEKEEAEWVDKQVALSAAMLRHLEQATGDVGSYPKMTTTKASRMGHLGSNANYRNFLVEQGWATQAWADRANQADTEPHANPAQKIVENRKSRAPRKLEQVVDFGQITLSDGSQGKQVEIQGLLTNDVLRLSSNHGSLKADVIQESAHLALKFTWQAGLGPGPWETNLVITEKTGKIHLLTVRGDVKP